MTASAVGFYGDSGERVLTEESPRGAGFFADVCAAWEEATIPAREVGVRTVQARIGVVITPRGGALGKQLVPFKAGAGAVLGSGRQWTPWIAVGDLVGALYHCVMNETVSGPVNCLAPKPVTNRQFAKSLGRVLSRPAFIWLPRPLLRLMFGGVADEALLASMNATPKKLLDTGFTFDHSDIDGALRFLLGKNV